MTTQQPKVSIIIVNFNGRHLLPRCLSSVFAIDYPRRNYEVIVVDNNSHDDSVAYIRDNFPQVKLVALDRNLGFTGGNNRGIEQAVGEYIVLLNTDTWVTKQWLKELVAAASDPQVGIVSSKLLFAIPFLELTIYSSTITQSQLDNTTDFTPIGVLMENIHSNSPNLDHLIWYNSGFYDTKPGFIPTRMTKERASILVPFNEQKDGQFVFTFHGYPTRKALPIEVEVRLGKNSLWKGIVSPRSVQQVSIPILQAQARRHFIWLVQNAGNVILRSGHSKDRGSLIRREKNVTDSAWQKWLLGKWRYAEFYEQDSSFYQQPSQLLSACGASCLIKKPVLDDIGLFDETFFMYYEDVDLSLRAWRRGWNIAYAPNSIVYHLHKASSQNLNSDLFSSMIQRNHLLLTLKHFPLLNFIIALTIMVIKLIIIFGITNVFRFLNKVQLFRRFRAKQTYETQALKFVLSHLRQLFKVRQALNRNQKRGYTELHAQLY